LTEFAYTTVPGKLQPLFSKLREAAVPTKATTQWLKSVGFRSSNDPTLLGVLKAIGFIDSTGAPTQRWSSFRGANSKLVLGKAIQEGYSDLFAVYPDAWQRSQTELEHVFSTSSSGGRQVISKAVSTFKSLVSLADFEAVPKEQGTNTIRESAPAPPTASAATKPAQQPSKAEPSVHIDIQIHIAPESTSEQIDQIFASMAKHLYGTQARG